jgi:quaternary ammonium compound-resistance protein SugE
MAWVLLSVAGVLEIAVAFGMKWAEGFTRFLLGRQIDLLDQLNG